MFELDGIELSFDHEALEQIVENCMASKTGARGLHAELEKTLLIHMFNSKKYVKNSINKINITRKLVNKPKALI